MKFKNQFFHSIALLLIVAATLFSSCQHEESLVPKSERPDVDALSIEQPNGTAPHAIKNFSPLSGYATTPDHSGVEVDIAGINLGFDPSRIKVTFNGVEAEVGQTSPENFTVIVPEGATTGKIIVEINGVKATTETDFVVTPFDAPVFYAIDPWSSAPGTNVILFGENFDPNPSGNVVMFNGVTAVVNAATTNRLFVTVPITATTGRVSITALGFTVTSPIDFTVLPPVIPVVGSFLPASGRPGTSVTIYGSDFSTVRSENEVTFNGVAAVVRSATKKILTVTVPANATTGRIAVTVNGFTGISFTDFTAIPRPIVTSFVPGIVRRSDVDAGFVVLSIQGSNFSTTPQQNVVQFQGSRGFVIGATTTTLSVVVPMGTTTGPFTVTVNGETGNSPFPLIVEEF